MAIASVGTRGTQISSTSNTTIARAPSAAVAAGRVLICQIAQNGNQDTSVADAQGNTWVFLGSGSNGANNARSDVWLCNVDTELSTANNVTVTFAGNVQHKSMLLWEFSVDAGNMLVESDPPIPNATSAGNGFGSANFSGLASVQRLYLRALAKQANITTAITATSGFTTQGLTIRSQNNAAAIIQRGEFRINTSTGETSNPTLANTGNTGNVFVALEEAPIPATVVEADLDSVGSSDASIGAARVLSALVAPSGEATASLAGSVVHLSTLTASGTSTAAFV